MQLTLYDLNPPIVRIYKESVELIFGNEEFTIFPTSNEIERNGVLLDFKKAERRYNKSFMFERNKAMPKTQLLRFDWENNVVQLDSGPDGRLFWKVWTREDYKTMRKPPFWVASYWYDVADGFAKLYIKDLHKPAHRWDLISGELME
ncbi:MAG: hypothetical protein EPO20_30580 [Betaproteobacteria bacterium]|nr:MAG: hypothetical protein EPO20_30580 [Betaproteobacteria bacterium]